MRTVHPHKADESAVRHPLSSRGHLDPVGSDSKVRVDIAGLPAVASQGDLP